MINKTIRQAQPCQQRHSLRWGYMENGSVMFTFASAKDLSTAHKFDQLFMS